jgi:hypothetical protein
MLLVKIGQKLLWIRHPGFCLWKSTLHENPIYVSLSWALRGLSLHFHFHVSVSHLYILPGSAFIFFLQQNRSQTHECGNWDLGRAFPFLGTFVSNFRYWFFAVQALLFFWLEYILIYSPQLSYWVSARHDTCSACWQVL